MTPMILVGVMFGAGLLLLVRVVAPPRVDLAVALGRWEVARRHASRQKSDHIGLRDHLGQRVADALARRGAEFPQLRTDLAITDTTLEKHIASMFLTAVSGFFVPNIFGTLATVAGVGVGFTVPLICGVFLAAAVVYSANAELHKKAVARRNELRRALGTYLDLVSMSLAGGRGVPEALPTCAAIGTGWAFDLIRHTIAGAPHLGDTPWKALGDLGTTVGLQELIDLSSALTLVGDNGAKIRSSLAARANTLRRKELAGAEAEAGRSDDSMRIAQIVLAMGFVLLIGYPAVVNVLLA